MTEIRSRPHNNGNDHSTFVTEGEDLRKTIIAAEGALQMIMADLMHGRNYQHISGDQAIRARASDLEMAGQMRKDLDRIKEFAENIMSIGLKLDS
jgi:hypothetical protein